MFKTFLLQLVAGAIVPLFLFSFFKRSLTGALPLTLTTDHTSGSLPGYCLSIGRALVQAYVWIGWAVYCGLLARTYGALEEVAISLTTPQRAFSSGPDSCKALSGTSLNH